MLTKVNTKLILEISICGNVDLFYLGYLGPINPSIGTIPTNKMISELHSIRKSDLIYVNVRLDKMVPIIYLIHICAALNTI